MRSHRILSVFLVLALFCSAACTLLEATQMPAHPQNSCHGSQTPQKHLNMRACCAQRALAVPSVHSSPSISVLALIGVDAVAPTAPVCVKAASATDHRASAHPDSVTILRI